MPLKGEARNTYMRDYMRRRRAAKPAVPPKGVNNATASPDHAALAQARNEITALRGELAQARVRIAELETRKNAGESTIGGQPKIQLSEKDYKKLAVNIHPNRWDYLKNEELTQALHEAFHVVGSVFELTKKEKQDDAKKRAEREAEDLAWRMKKGAERMRRQAAARKSAATHKAKAEQR